MIGRKIREFRTSLCCSPQPSPSSRLYINDPLDRGLLCLEACLQQCNEYVHLLMKVYQLPYVVQCHHMNGQYGLALLECGCTHPPVNTCQWAAPLSASPTRQCPAELRVPHTCWTHQILRGSEGSDILLTWIREARSSYRRKRITQTVPRSSMWSHEDFLAQKLIITKMQGLYQH